MCLVFLYLGFLCEVAVWLIGNALVSVNEVTLCQARLGMHVHFNSRRGNLFRYIASHFGQLSLAIPPWVGAMSTSDGYSHC